MEAMEARDVFGEENSSGRDGKQLEGGKIGVLLWCEFLWLVMSAAEAGVDLLRPCQVPTFSGQKLFGDTRRNVPDRTLPARVDLKTTALRNCNVTKPSPTPLRVTYP